MLIVERQQRLLGLLKERRMAQIDELASQLEVSSSTVRRDLEALENQKLVQRTHGGAVYLGARADEEDARFPLEARMSENVVAKRAIGAHAASMIGPNMTVILDGGSTVLYAAERIVARPIQIVTNSLSVANLFKDDDKVELALLGGSLYPRTEVTVGPITTGTLMELHADLCLFSLAGIEGEDAYNINIAMARVEQVMMQQAGRSVMLMDSSKFGHRSLVRVCSLADVDEIVTDSGLENVDAWRERIPTTLTVVDA